MQYIVHIITIVTAAGVVNILKLQPNHFAHKHTVLLLSGLHFIIIIIHTEIHICNFVHNVAGYIFNGVKRHASENTLEYMDNWVII